MAKIHRHETNSISAPPPSGPITNAIPVHAVHDPIAAPRSSSGKTAVISARLDGTSSAPAIPCSARAAISSSALGAIAHSAEVSPKPTSPHTKTRRRPRMSPSEPPTRISEPSVSRYASTTHCCSASPASRSSRIAGSATLTTVPSRNTTLEPRMAARRVSRLVLAIR